MPASSAVPSPIYRIKRSRSAQGHEQQGERYAVVVQANAYEDLST
jgi:mRNA-degrading endonuclease toxin of MazEF toxin-antitoxin module